MKPVKPQRAVAPKPVWTHGERAQARRARRYEATMGRRWRMHYDLAYDGGGSDFDVYYRTRLGARWSAFWHLHVRSWGGSAELFDQEKFRAHEMVYFYDWGTGNGDDREGYRCWCGRITLGTTPRARRLAKRHEEMARGDGL